MAEDLQQTTSFGSSPQLEPRRRLSTFSDQLNGKRATVSAELAREIRIRDGCDNMISATTALKGKKTKEHKEHLKAMETIRGFALSRIATLTHELQQLNGAVQTTVRKSVRYRNFNEKSGSKAELIGTGKNTIARIREPVIAAEGKDDTIPIIALNTKQTKELDLKKPFSKTLSSHYLEDPAKFDGELEELQATRRLVMDPHRDEESLVACYKYFHYTQQAEHRFFHDERTEEIVFEWTDSFTGIPAVHKSINVEKASVLFSAAALHTQLAAEVDSLTLEGILSMIEHFEMAAGAFEFLMQNFAESYSEDLSQDILKMLLALMLAQAQECHWHYSMLQNQTERIPADEWCAEYKEAAAVAEMYAAAAELLRNNAKKGCIPSDWIHIVEAKMHYFQSVSDYYYALDLRRDNTSQVAETTAKSRLTRSREVLASALRSYRKDPRVMIPELEQMLSKQLEVTSSALGGSEHACDRKEWESLPLLKGESMGWTQPDCPYLGQAPPDLFNALGPLYFFNALCALSGKRSLTVVKGDKGYGFTLKGNSPVNILEVAAGGASDVAGLQAGEYILELNGEDVRACTHDEVVSRVKASKGVLNITVLENVDMLNFEELVGQMAPKPEDVIESEGRAKAESVVMDTLPLFGRIVSGSLSGRSGGSFEFLDSTADTRKASEDLSNAFA